MQGAGVKNTVRTLTAADIPWAFALSALAGWNQTEADWKHLLHLAPETCLGIECEGSVAATATLVCYKDQFAWAWHGLNASSLSKPRIRPPSGERRVGACRRAKHSFGEIGRYRPGPRLYQSLGFREERGIERWSGPGRVSSDPTARLALTRSHFKLDSEAVGADRTQVLNSLGEIACIVDDGFAFWRAGARASYLGPCVARSEDSARRLVESFLSTNDGQWYWDLFPSNPSAVKLACDLNFKVERKLVRMVKGSDWKGSESMIYAGSGFELG